MKRLIVLMALLVMTGMLWAQAAPMGPALTLNAFISYMELTDFGAGKEFTDKPQFELKFNWVVDDLNIAYLELEEGPMGVSGGKGFNTADIANSGYPSPANAALGQDAVAQIVDKAWFQTDVGKALKLPVGLTVKYGLNEWNNVDTTYVDKTDWAEFLGEKDIRTWGIQGDVMFAPVFTLRATTALNPRLKQTLVGAYGSMAPISYEATYFTNSQDPDKGWLEGGAKYVADVAQGINLGVSGAAEYDLQDQGTVANPTWRLQGAVSMLYNKMALLGLGWRGQDQATAGGLQVQGWVMPMAGTPLELWAIAGIGLSDKVYASGLDEMEVSVKYTFGKAYYYVGFLYAAEDSPGDNIGREVFDSTPAGQALNAGNGVTGIFIRGSISF